MNWIFDDNNRTSAVRGPGVFFYLHSTMHIATGLKAESKSEFSRLRSLLAPIGRSKGRPIEETLNRILRQNVQVFDHNNSCDPVIVKTMISFDKFPVIFI